MLRLEIESPFDGIDELLTRLFENIYRLGIIDARKVAVDDVFELGDKPVLEPRVEEFELGLAALEKMSDDALYHIGRYLDYAVDIAERDLGLYLPELGGVTRRVAVLRAERRTEGVYPAERRRHDLALELTGNRKSRTAPEKVFFVVLLRALDRRVESDRRHLEHLARALAVAAGDYGRMYVVIAVFMKILVYRIRQLRPDAEHRVKGVGAHAQMRYRAQVFHGVSFLLERIARIARAEQLYAVRAYLDVLVFEPLFRLARHF